MRATLLLCCCLALPAQTLDVWTAKSEVRTVEAGAAVKLTGTRSGGLTGETHEHGDRAGLRQRGLALPHRTLTAGRDGAVRRKFPDAVADGRDARQTGGSRVQRAVALQDPAAGGREGRDGHDDADAAGRAHDAAGVHERRRFNGRFFLRPKSIEVVLDTEGLALGPGESWEMEEFLYTSGSSRPALLAKLASRIAEHIRR